jgi:hypothetical protein
MPFIKSTASQCDPNLSADYPGSSTLVPQALVLKILGGG